MAGLRSTLWFLAALFFKLTAFSYACLAIAAIGERHGVWWGAGSLVITILLRSTPIITYGAWVAARDFLDWGIFASLLFAFPALALLIPGLALQLTAASVGMFRAATRRPPPQ